VTHIKKISQFPTLVAAHRAEVRGPPVGRGPQVEKRWLREFRDDTDEARRGGGRASRLRVGSFVGGGGREVENRWLREFRDDTDEARRGGCSSTRLSVGILMDGGKVHNDYDYRRFHLRICPN